MLVGKRHQFALRVPGASRSCPVHPQAEQSVRSAIPFAIVRKRPDPTRFRPRAQCSGTRDVASAEIYPSPALSATTSGSGPQFTRRELTWQALVSAPVSVDRLTPD